MATSDSHPEFGVYVPDVTLAVALKAASGGDSTPLVRFDFANGDTMSSPSINTGGFSFDTTTRTIAQAPNGQMGLEFSYNGSLYGNSWEEQRYSMGPLFETYEKIVLWIPSNFEHRHQIKMEIAAGTDMSQWAQGDEVTSQGSSTLLKGIYSGTLTEPDGTPKVVIKYPSKPWDGAWVGTLTNATRSLTVETLSKTTATINNKFSAQWEGDYSSNGMIIEYTHDVASSYDGREPIDAYMMSFTTGSSDDPNSSDGRNAVTDGVMPPAIDMANDPGKLHDFVIRRRRSSSLEASDGITQIWKNGVMVFQVLDMPLFHSTRNYFDRGYLLGYANSGFDEDTVFYVTKYELYGDTRPDGIPA